MSAKTRIRQLEKHAPKDDTSFEYVHFVQTIDGDKHTYTMGKPGNVREVDEEAYNRELAEYRPLAIARGVCAEIQIVLPNGDDHDNQNTTKEN